MNPQVQIVPDESTMPREPQSIMLGGTRVGSIKLLKHSVGSSQWMAYIDLRGPGVPSCTEAHGFGDTHEGAIADLFRRNFEQLTATMNALRLMAKQFDLPLYDVEPGPDRVLDLPLCEVAF